MTRIACDCRTAASWPSWSTEANLFRVISGERRAKLSRIAIEKGHGTNCYLDHLHRHTVTRHRRVQGREEELLPTLAKALDLICLEETIAKLAPEFRILWTAHGLGITEKRMVLAKELLRSVAAGTQESSVHLYDLSSEREGYDRAGSANRIQLALIFLQEAPLRGDI
jgi:hypothetical protein